MADNDLIERLRMEAMTSEREAFEKWADDQGYPMQRLDIGDGDDYQDLRTEGVWIAWQARAHLAQPAQAVDVGTVRRVIAELEGYCEASEGSCYGTLSTDLVRGYTQQLSGAIQGLGDDGWKLVPLELTPEMAAAASAAVWPVASAEDREKARAAALIVLKTTMELVPGATLDSLAAGIATMFPAYRAFIAAAPTRALSVQKAGPVGDGWKLVPHEPTAEMMDAAWRIVRQARVLVSRNVLCAAFQSMWNASPAPGKEGEG